MTITKCDSCDRTIEKQASTIQLNFAAAASIKQGKQDLCEHCYRILATILEKRLLENAATRLELF